MDYARASRMSELIRDVFQHPMSYHVTNDSVELQLSDFSYPRLGYHFVLEGTRGHPSFQGHITFAEFEHATFGDIAVNPDILQRLYCRVTSLLGVNWCPNRPQPGTPLILKDWLRQKPVLAECRRRVRGQCDAASWRVLFEIFGDSQISGDMLDSIQPMLSPEHLLSPIEKPHLSFEEGF